MAQDGLHVSALSIQVHNDEGAGQLVPAGALPECVFEDVGVQVPGAVIAIEEHRLGAEIAGRNCSLRRR